MTMLVLVGSVRVVGGLNLNVTRLHVELFIFCEKDDQLTTLYCILTLYYKINRVQRTR